MIFNIGTDVENFHNVMPDYFKPSYIVKKSKTQIILVEKIKFLGIQLSVKTKHVIIPPNFHEVYILSGPTKGTIFLSHTKNLKMGLKFLLMSN